MTFKVTKHKALPVHSWNHCYSHPAGTDPEQPPGPNPAKPAPHQHRGRCGTTAAAQRHASDQQIQPTLNSTGAKYSGHRIR